MLLLAGSDGSHGPVPVDMRESDMLRGYKGAITLPNGKPLAQELIDRLAASNRFAPILLLGPRNVYEKIIDREVIDVAGKLPAVLEKLRETIYGRFAPNAPIAVCAGDILPTPTELIELIDHSYRPHASSSFWWQLIQAAPQAMGQSDWKQAYRLKSSSQGEVQPYYPGHLVIVRPAALRLRLMNQLLALSYRFRNRVIRKKFLPMALSGAATLLIQDAKNLLRGQLPTLTLSVLWQCFSGLQRYRKNQLSVDEFADRVSKLLIHRVFRQPNDPPAVVFSPTNLVSFAKDFDSQRELKELFDQLRQ